MAMAGAIALYELRRGRGWTQGSGSPPTAGRGSGATRRRSSGCSPRTPSTARARSGSRTSARSGIRDYWTRATSTQEELELRFGEPVVEGNKVVVEWWAIMRDEDAWITLPGCLLLRFDERRPLRGAPRVLARRGRPARPAPRLGPLTSPTAMPRCQALGRGRNGLSWAEAWACGKSGQGALVRAGRVSVPGTWTWPLGTSREPDRVLAAVVRAQVEPAVAGDDLEPGGLEEGAPLLVREPGEAAGTSPSPGRARCRVRTRRSRSQSASSQMPGSRSSQRPCVSSTSSTLGAKTSKTKRPPGSSRPWTAASARRRSASVVQVEERPERGDHEPDTLRHRRVAEVAEPQVEQVVDAGRLGAAAGRRPASRARSRRR